MRFSLLLAPLLLASCSGIRGTLPPAASPQGTGAFRAGAAKVDITPPPGYPMGGHSQSGKIARGFWSRLHSRAIYLQDADGRGLALVSCDLWSLPAGLADRVAELLALEPCGPPLARDQIVLAATHTHHSPGNFSSCPLYNKFASPKAGFDRDLFEFLAGRIASAITAAVRARQPARIFYADKPLGMVARNRSFPAFVRNPESDTILRQNACLPEGSRSAEYPTLEAYHAVDPVLKVLRIESASTPGTVIAVAGFFTVHATAMSHDTEFFTSDLFGVATTLAEQELSASLAPGQSPPVVALFNGAEGDISPAWEKQDRANTVRIGKRLADGISALLTGGNSVDGPLNWRFTNAPLANVTFTTRDGAVLSTADHPLPGAPMLGGAEDGRTVFSTQGYIEGLTGPPTPHHGVKLGAFDIQHAALAYLKLGPVRLTCLFVAKSSVPRQAPVGLYQIGGPRGVTLATLPGEFTLVMGRRIADSVRANLAGGNSRVLTVGLANEYVSYFTTPEEYAAQHYEGASTLYGPNAGTLVGYQLGSLASWLHTAAPTFPGGAFDYATGRKESFGVTRLKRQKPGAVEAAVQVVIGGLPRRQFDWDDTTPRLGKSVPADARLTPRVGIEVRSGGRWEPLRVQDVEETNEGLNFVTLVTVPGRNRSTWRAVWMPPGELGPGGSYRFRVEKIDGTVVTSEDFQL